MQKLFILLLAWFVLPSDLPAQMLILDRGPAAGSSTSLGLPKQSEGFLADDFQVGTATEDWVIDHIRLWAVPDPRATNPRDLGDLVKKISLYGGIAPDPPPPDQKPGADCDCHNLPALEVAALEPGSDSTDNPNVKVSSDQGSGTPLIWQIDFENLKWSVPGGTGIQFGVLADPYPNYGWFYLASPAAAGPHLRVFSNVGKFQGPFHSAEGPRINIQVWGHLLARISIEGDAGGFRVTLWGASSLDAGRVDTASLRFGPRSASPGKVQVEDVNHDGKLDLVIYFRAADIGLGPKSVNACLSGRLENGTPFEGCDLLAH